MLSLVEEGVVLNVGGGGSERGFVVDHARDERHGERAFPVGHVGNVIELGRRALHDVHLEHEGAVSERVRARLPPTGRDVGFCFGSYLGRLWSDLDE